MQRPDALTGMTELRGALCHAPKNIVVPLAGCGGCVTDRVQRYENGMCASPDATGGGTWKAVKKVVRMGVAG